MPPPQSLAPRPLQATSALGNPRVDIAQSGEEDVAVMYRPTVPQHQIGEGRPGVTALTPDKHDPRGQFRGFSTRASQRASLD